MHIKLAQVDADLAHAHYDSGEVGGSNQARGAGGVRDACCISSCSIGLFLLLLPCLSLEMTAKKQVEIIIHIIRIYSINEIFDIMFALKNNCNICF